jgi:hypothetical protein
MIEDTSSNRSLPSAAERMRLSRQRRRKGVRPVRMLLHATQIEILIQKGYLDPDQRENTEALQGAVSDLLFELAMYL